MCDFAGGLDCTVESIVVYDSKIYRRAFLSPTLRLTFRLHPSIASVGERRTARSLVVVDDDDDDDIQQPVVDRERAPLTVCTNAYEERVVRVRFVL